jgi:4-amino-4-deoxy-L-arabinose transferase-like glycosyltransferase
MSRRIGPSGAAASLRRIPISALLIGLALFAILAAFAGADPASHVTFSSSPFTDEAFNTVNARNFVQLGRFGTDEWNLYLVNSPFSLLVALVFKLIGVGIVQARLVTIVCVSLTAAALTWGLRAALGRWAAAVAGLAFAGSGLTLIYGRLAYLEDLVVLAVTIGALTVASERRLSIRWGLFSGVWFAIAIGTKPSAAAPIAGVVLALAVVYGFRDRAVLRWIAGAGIAIALAGLAWLVVVWLPNRDAVAMDLRIWEQVKLNLTPGAAARSIYHYLTNENDMLLPIFLGPLLALGAAGTVAVVALRRRLGSAEARLAVASIGWLVVGFGVLAITTYRPNRYAVPLVPALAILAAIGVHLATDWLAEKRTAGSVGGSAHLGTGAGLGLRSAGGSAAGRRLGPALATLAVVIAVAPGLAWYGNWARGATYNLPSIQDRMALLVPDGQEVAGRESALFLMRSGAVTLITQPGGGAANNGDLYAAGVRWYVLPANDPPPKGVPAAVWAARESAACGVYGGLTECLFHLR